MELDLKNFARLWWPCKPLCHLAHIVQDAFSLNKILRLARLLQFEVVEAHFRVYPTFVEHSHQEPSEPDQRHWNCTFQDQCLWEATFRRQCAVSLCIIFSTSSVFFARPTAQCFTPLSFGKLVQIHRQESYQLPLFFYPCFTHTSCFLDFKLASKVRPWNAIPAISASYVHLYRLAF